MYNTIRTYTNQVKVSGHHSLSTLVQSDPSAILDINSSGRDLTTRLLDLFSWLFITHKCSRWSLPRIARHLDCSERTVRRKLDIFLEHGLIWKKYQFKQTNIYMLNPRIFLPEMMNKLQGRSKFLRKVSLCILLAPSGFIARMVDIKTRSVRDIGSKLEKARGDAKSPSIYVCIYNYHSFISNNLYKKAFFTNDDPGQGYYQPNFTYCDPSKVRPVYKKEGIVMNFPRCKRLTDDAKVHLMAFPEHVIEDALTTMEKMPNILNKVRWLQSRCSTICKEKNIRPEWNLAATIRDSTNPQPNCEIYIQPSPVTQQPKVIKTPPPPRINRRRATDEELAALKGTEIGKILENLRMQALERERNGT